MLNLNKKYYIAVVCKVIAVLVSFISSVLISRGLGVDLKGEYAYITELIEILYVIFGMALGQTYATYKYLYGEKIRTIFIELIFIHGFLAFLICNLIGILCGFNLFTIAVLTTIAVIWANITMVAVIDNSIKRNMITTVIDLAGLLILSALFYLKIFTLELVLIYYAVTKIVNIIIILFAYSIKPSYIKIKFTELIRIYKYCLITMIVMLLITINYRVDIVMIRHLSSSSEVGIYSVAVTLSNIFLVIPDAFKEVLFEKASNGEHKQDAYASITASIVISGIMIIGFLLFGKWFISLFYGAEYGSSYNLTLILWLGTVPLVFFKVLQPIYISLGKQSIAAIYLGVSAVINILVNLSFIRRYNAVGAAWATTISYSICGVLFLLNYKYNLLKLRT